MPPLVDFMPDNELPLPASNAPISSHDARRSRFFWSVLAILSTMLLIGMVALLTMGCQKKQADAPPSTPAVNADVRTRKNTAKASAKRADSLNARNQQTVTDYESALSHYDSIQLYLPE